ncbi:MAG: leucine--tRNA ligase [Verrucomicrobiae bacterium]|nr:leucine--tRNA ligase [Verrucomicrobiae bacterium]
MEFKSAEIEQHWKTFWSENGVYEVSNDSDKPKYYILDMFPYPSGSGLHVGHPLGYIASDILSRYKRMKGFNVLHPMGYDAFGLPAEQYAIQTGVHPAKSTAENISRYRSQLDNLGFSFDWSREVQTCDPSYYKWTQWIFLQLFKRGLAYVSEQPVWWCPALGTVLANEEVIDGKSERGNHPVERRKLRQWVLKITAYAERLLEGHDQLHWPDSSIRLQKNWIGRSTGAEVEFSLEGHADKLRIYTTRPDTLFGVTYMVLSPEHPLVDSLTTADQKEAVQNYITAASKKSDLERTDLAKDKTGVFSGSYAINPVNGEKVPIWVADYVLMSYGTGAIMAVPGHDERDFEFAEAMNIPIVPVIEDFEAEKEGKETQLPFCGKGTMVNSGEYSGLESDAGKAKIIADLENRDLGAASVQYKLRDWLFSRQRYWGEPFPVTWVSLGDYEKAAALPDSLFSEFLPEEPVTFEVDGETRYALPVPTSQLPLYLPEVESYQPTGTGESPLAAVPEWLKVWLDLETGETKPRSEARPAGDNWVAGTRETNTMPQWAGSCWYYLRYCDPRNPDAVIDSEKAKYWGVPDFYIGGAEHVNLHLLYARFWHQVLFDAGVTPCPEPFPYLLHQGMILGEVEYTLFTDADGNALSADQVTESEEIGRKTLDPSEVEKSGDQWVLKSDNSIIVDARAHKMSKSRGNVVNPDQLINDYGSDAMRLFLMFLGPIEDMKPWNTQGIEGVSRFLRRLWREVVAEDGSLNSKLLAGSEKNQDVEKVLHESIKKITDDIDRLSFNTVVSQLMILLNQLTKADSYSQETARIVVQLLNPVAPHISEELWSRLSGNGSVSEASWPQFDASKLVTDEVKVVLQVNGKHRGELMVAKDATKEEVEKLGLSQERVINSIEGKTVRKVIYVPGRILNVVAN